MKKVLFAALIAFASAASFAGTSQAAEAAASPSNENCVLFVAEGASHSPQTNTVTAPKVEQLCGAEVLPDAKVSFAGSEFPLHRVRRADGAICETYMTGVLTEQNPNGDLRRANVSFGTLCRPAA